MAQTTEQDQNAPKAETAAQRKKRLAEEAAAANQGQIQQPHTDLNQGPDEEGEKTQEDPPKTDNDGSSENKSTLIQTEPTLGTTENSESRELGPLDLKITNSGTLTHCNVSRTELPLNTAVTITYQNENRKALAKRNFAQLNALAGRKRFQVEG